MEPLATGSLLSSQLIKALGVTLMHSLWQGVLLAAAAGLIIVFTKKRSAALRYNLLTGAMLLFALGCTVTFLAQLQPAPRGQALTLTAAAGAPQHLQVVPTVRINTGDASPAKNVADVVSVYLNRYCNTIVLIWFLIICAKSIRLAAGVYEVYQLRRTKTTAIAGYWKDRVEQLSAQLHIRRVIGLVESGVAKVPMVIGHLKPLILIPVGFINALSADEVEAILVHELAHIHRRDYLVNLLQSFMEIIFFFNPAVLWLSQLVRAERENCCDDIALAQAGSKYSYIQALLNCQQYQESPQLSMALARNKGNLLSRVKRMVNNHNQSLNIMEKTLLTICLVAAGLGAAAFSAKTVKTVKAHAPAIRTKISTAAPVDKSITEPAKQIIPPAIRHTSGNTAAVKSNAPEAVIAVADTSIAKVKVYSPSDFGDGTTMKVTDVKQGKVATAYLFKRNGVLYQVNMNGRKRAELYVNGDAKPVSEYNGKIDNLMEEFREEAKEPLAPVPPVRPLSPSVNLSPVPPVNSPLVNAAVIAGPPSPPSVNLTPLPPVPPARMTGAIAALAPLPPGKTDDRFDKALDELVKKGIIKDRANVDVDISTESLKVNGEKQPEEVHQQILKMFVIKPGDKINWHYSKETTKKSKSN